MSKMEDRENRRRASVVAPLAGVGFNTPGMKKGRPKEDRELKKRVSLSVLPSVYEDIQKIAYVQRRSVSEVIECLLMQYREEYSSELNEYKSITGNK